LILTKSCIFLEDHSSGFEDVDPEEGEVVSVDENEEEEYKAKMKEIEDGEYLLLYVCMYFSYSNSVMSIGVASLAPVSREIAFEEIKSVLEAWTIFLTDKNGKSALANASLASIMNTGPCKFTLYGDCWFVV
jgi:hypothetical protein